MINITDKNNCCGCSACIQSCPKQCISFDEDEQGFRYPLVNKALCIDCGLCEKVCPCLNLSEPRKPLKVYAAINRNEEIRLKSSSGGIFTMLAEAIIDEGGVVFGARFDDNWEVTHDYTESKEGIAAFRGSKYVQSRIGNTYTQTLEFLKADRKVLFSGTPCQIAGLKKFLRKEYDNLLTVDFVCHGVPSPLVWRTYLKETLTERSEATGKNTVLSSSLNIMSEITDISFREKQTGGYDWKKYGFVVLGKSASEADSNSVLLSSTFSENQYMQSFLLNLTLRPSCYDCKVKEGRSLSDLTIADFWSVDKHHPDFYDDKGVSSVFVMTEKGEDIITSLKERLSIIETTYNASVDGNYAYYKSVPITQLRMRFWKAFGNKKKTFRQSMTYTFCPPLYKRIIDKIKRTLKR